MTNVSDDTLVAKILKELQIALRNLSLAETSKGREYSDLIWRANAHAELAIGISRLQLPEDSVSYTNISSKRKSAESSIPDLQRIRELLESAVKYQVNGLYEKSLGQTRAARDLLNSLLLEERRSEMKLRRNKKSVKSD